VKNIAIFCDGTWQNLGQSVPTNVGRLARSVAPTAASPSEGVYDQFVYYDDGVGVGEGVLNGATRIIGGGLGEGLDAKIMHAYASLCLNYAPGDRIFIFGFSRGAYTARSLVGMLRKCWILRRENASDVDLALDLYRTATLDSPDVLKFKNELCHPATPFVKERETDPKAAADQLAKDDGFWGHVQYVGVWDTVGSLGIPKTLPFAPDFNAKYRFHDTSLSRFVLSARHAVSIDERRGSFTPTLWDNIDDLNDNAGASGVSYEHRPYQQCWFPGRHSAVGGGEDDGGISIPALTWVAEGAIAAGLEFDPAALNIPPTANPCAPFVPPKTTLVSFAISALGGESDRDGPVAFYEISECARARWKGISDYRPKPLSKFADMLR
jgi:uncharacterized protein (DUF2235 family)